MSTRHPPGCTVAVLHQQLQLSIYIYEGVTSTNDITMEDNPSYQSIEVAGTESALMESTQSELIIPI